VRILFLSRWFPFPPDNGSKIRIFNILRQLAERHEVALVAFGDPRDCDDLQARRALREFCSSVEVVRYREFRPSSVQATLGLFSRQPRSFVDTFSPEMARAICDARERERPDLVIASQLQLVPYALSIEGIPAVLEELELTTFRDAVRRAGPIGSRVRASLTWLKLTDYLRRVLPRFAACTVASPAEQAILRQALPEYHAVSVIPNALDLSRYAGDFGSPQPDTLIFSGALAYHANLDALRYFLADAYPLVRRAIPNVRLRVTGDNRAVDLSRLPDLAGVEFTGYLDDIRPALAQSWASVVPLRLGGGTRLKILEAMALGTPVISTSKGAEGLAVTDGESLLLADSPADFASQVTAVLRSPGLREHLARGGRQLVAGSYDWRAVGAKLEEVISRAARPRVVA
jgi:glycosyltransferase involved in cell wall biosynthesis